MAPDENPLDAFAEAKKQVEKSHQFFVDLPTFERAQKIVDNPDDYTGRDMKAAHEVIKANDLVNNSDEPFKMITPFWYDNYKQFLADNKNSK